MSKDITMKVVGLDSLLKGIKKADQKANSLYNKALTSTLIKGKAIMRKESPFITGGLRRSIDIEKDSAKLRGKIFPAEKYGLYVEDGTRPHPINGPVKIKGNWVYIKTHPGTKKNPFVERTFDKIKPIALTNFGKAVDLYLRIIAK